jgi:ligand-binding SRPBCC domain-containing protein
MRDFRTEPITESITINAPLTRCFALSTRVELVRETLGMNLLDTGLTSGHITANSRVVWRGWKFGLPTEHHTLITGFAEPHIDAGNQLTAWFQDSQERGRFAFFQHDHFFRESSNPTITTLHDEIRFTLPFGPLGRLAAGALLAPHIRKLARRRFARIKALAEGDGWRAWTPE